MRVTQRAVDVVVSVPALLICAPLFLCIAAFIKWDSRGPILYRARRVGRYGRIFTMYKFRTMVHSSATAPRQPLTTANDRRVTLAGQKLRRAKLDELPQLLNVLFGDMSLVGPRPEDPQYVAAYPPQYRRILDVTPGMTSLASLTFADEEKLLAGPCFEEIYLRDILPRKLEGELRYESTRTTTTDCRVIGRTASHVIRRFVSYAAGQSNTA